MKLRKVAAEEPFVLAAMASLLGALVWLNLRPRLLLQFFYSAEMLALTHLVTLGFASSLVQGLSQRLVPQLLSVARPTPRAAWGHCVAWLLGASGIVFHFAVEGFVGMAWATLLTLAAALWFCRNFAGVWRAARGGDPVARWVAASCCHFALVATLGASYAALRVWGIGAAWLGAPLLDRLGAHLHLGLVGWIGGAIFGWQLKFLPGTRASERVERWRFWTVQLGLLLLTAALIGGAPTLRGGALLVAAGLAARSVPALASWRRNAPGRVEIAAHALLLLLAVVGVALAFDWPAADAPLRYPLELAYGYVGLLGWVVLTVIGTSWKLFSTWVWEERFLPERGLKPTPRASDLPSAWLRDGSAFAVVAGLALTVAAILRSADGSAPLLLLRGGLALHLLGVLLFAAQFLRIARWELLQLDWHPPR